LMMKQHGKKAFFIFRLTVSIGIMVYLITVFDWNKVIMVLTQLRIEYMWPAPFLLILSFYFAGVRWRALLTHFGIQLKARDGFVYYLIGNFYNIMLPGVIGGDVIRVGICAAIKKGSVANIALTALIERIFGMLVVLAVGTLAILLLPDPLRTALGTPVTVTMPLMTAGAFLALIGGGIFFFLMPSPWFENNNNESKIIQVLLRVISKIKKISIPTFFTVILWSAFFQTSNILASYFLAKAINIDLPLALFFVVFPIAYILTALPISLGGLGVREGIIALLLSRVGILPSDAVMFSFLVYFNWSFVSLLGGVAQLVWDPVFGVKKVLAGARQDSGSLL